MVLHESELSHKAATNSLPLQDAFAVLFFVSVGMLFDPSIVVREPMMVLGVLGLILLGKSLVALGIVLLMGYPLRTALIVSAALAQIGEFSFILAGLGIDHGLLSREGLNLVLAGALLSITLNPLVFALADKACAYVGRRPALKRRFDDNRQAHISALEADLEAARLAAEEKAAAHKTFSPAELVERFPLFGSLSEEQREVLLLHFQVKNVTPGERVIRKGDEADAVYFISSGEMEVAVNGRKIKLRAGDFFGEMALICDQPRSADVTALDFSRLAMLTLRDFGKFLKKYPAMREKVEAMAAERNLMNKEAAVEG